MTRFNNDVVPIDRDKVMNFFEQRAAGYKSDTPYTSILYQDHDPDVAAQRDNYEKRTIIPELTYASGTHVLDIGCGIGRWAEALAANVASYTGIDLSPGLIDIAKARLPQSNTQFLVGGADDLGRADIQDRGRFDLVIMSGIMIYLNDDELRSCLQGLTECVANGGQVYMREPLALQDRLTLSEFWSEDLQQHYSAIYRSAEELETVFAQTLYAKGFETVCFQKLYKDERLNNRSETAQHFAIVNRPDIS